MLKDCTQVLSNRETQILQRIADGYTSREIAAIYFLSQETVETHRKSIIRKLDVSNLTQAVAYAIRQKLII